MATGIFITDGTARFGPMSSKRLVAYRDRLHLAREKRMRLFAELLAEGWSIGAAAQELGVSQQAGSKMFTDMRERLGWQAV